MEIERKKLLDALTLARPGLATSDVVEQASMFVFRKKDIVTFNDELCVRVMTKVGIEGAVQAQELYALLSKLRAENVILETTDDELQVKTGKKSVAGIRLSTKVYLPIGDINEAGDFEKLPEDFIKALQLTSQTAAKNASSTPVLASLHFIGNMVESCDNFRLTRYMFADDVEIPEFLLPISVAKEVVKFEPTEFSVVEGWVHFRTSDGVWLSCRTLDPGPKGYPNLDNVVEVEGEDVTFPDGFEELLDQASIFVDKSTVLDEFVSVEFKKKRVWVTSEGEKGWFQKDMPCDEGNPQCQFYVNPSFLASILPLLSTATVGENYMKLQGKNFLHCVCLHVPDEK